MSGGRFTGRLLIVWSVPSALLPFALFVDWREPGAC